MQGLKKQKKNRSIQMRAHAITAVVQRLEERKLFAFTAGDLVVYRVGTGSAALTSAATAVSIDEYTTGSNQTSPVVSSAVSLTSSGTAKQEGGISLSPNGEYLAFPGYTSTAGTATPYSVAGNQAVGIIDSTGTVDSTTSLGSSAIGGDNIYDAATTTTNGTNGGVYAGGYNSGAVYQTTGASGSTPATNVDVTNDNSTYAIQIYNGNLYLSNYKTPYEISETTGTPAASATFTNAISPIVYTANTPGATVSYEPGEFAFATLNGGSAPDTLYVADYKDNGIDKLSLVNGSWVVNGELGGTTTDPLEYTDAIVATPTAGGEELYVTTPSKIYSYLDSSGYNKNFTGATAQTAVASTGLLTTVATAATNEAFRGIAFAPQTSLTVATNPTSVTKVEGSTATLFAAAAPGTDATVQWQVNTGSGFVNLTNGTDANGVVISGVTSNTLKLSNISVLESGYTYQAVFTDPSGTFSSVTSSTATVKATFTPGDLIVEQAGTATNPGSTSSAAPIVLDEYSPTGTLVDSIPLPTATSGANNPITVSGSNTSEGEISLASNATSLLIPGYDTTVGTTGITNSATILREIGELSATGSINTSTTLGTALESGYIYSVASADGNNLYAAGTKGIAYTTLGSTSNANLVNSLSTYGITVNSNTLYATPTTGSSPPVIVGTSGTLPTGSASTTPLPGVSFSAISGAGVGYSRELAFANLSGGSSPDTLYVADAYNDCVDKLSLVNGSWVLNGTIGAYGFGGNPLAYVNGIVAEPVAGGEQLFISISNTATGTSKLETITDPYGYNSAGPTPDISGSNSNTVFSETPTLTTLATANNANATPFKGLAFVPQTGLTVTTSPSPAVNGTVAGSTTLFAAVAAGTDATVQWQVNTGSGFVNLSNGTDANGEVVAGATTNTLTLSNLSAADSGYTYRAVFSDPSGTFSSVTSGSEVLTISNTPVVSSVSPNYDFPTGAGYVGKTVTITGTNFTGTTAVDFGSVVLTSGSFTVNGAGTQITVTDPSEAAGVVDVTVVANGNTSATVSADKFYYETAPTVTGVSPATGLSAGGTAITITGTGFIPGSTVKFVPTSGTSGSTASATSVVVVSPTQITAVSPSDPNATIVDVEVTTPQGTSPATSTQSSNQTADEFTYTATTIAAIEGLTTGSSTVTIDSNPVVTAVLTTPGNPATVNGIAYTNYQIFIQDTTANGGDAIDLFGSTLGSGSYIPAVGDTVQVTGITNVYHGTYELENITAISKTGTASVPTPATTTAATLNFASTAYSVPAAYDDKLVELSGITVSSDPTEPALPATYGVSNLYGKVNDSSDASNPLELYYYPSSYQETNANFDGVAIPTGTPVSYVGFVQIYPGTSGSTNQAEFIPVEQVDSNGNPVKSDVFTLSTNEPAISSNTLAETDNFDQANRGDIITATVTRSEINDAATIQYELLPDSAVAGTDYDAGSGAPATTGTLTFPAGTQTRTFTITVNATPGDHGDKDFSIDLLNAQTTTSPATYIASLGGGPVNILIYDPTTQSTAGNVSTPSNSINENASIDDSGPDTTSTTVSGTTTTTLTTSKLNIEAPGNVQRGASESDPSYALLNFNDPGDTYDYLTDGGTAGNGNSVGTIKTIDGIELETFDSPEYYDVSGTLDVYMLDNSNTIPANDYSGTGTGLVGTGTTKLKYVTNSSNADSYSNGVGGTTAANGVITGSTLGTLYPLGDIAYNFQQTPSGYQPFNLTALNPVGTYELAKDISNGSLFTVVILPGDNNVTATLGGSTNAVSDESPILRVNFTTSLPTWVTGPGVNADGSSQALWIIPTQTFYTTVNATITADPQATDGSLPTIEDLTSNTTVSFTPTATSATTDSGLAPTDFHIGGVDLSNGADLVVTQIDAPSSTDTSNGSYSADDHSSDHDVLVIGSTSATSVPVISILGTSKLDLADNDLIIHTGSASYSAAQALFSSVQALGQQGRNAPDHAGPDGPWTGNGLTSSTAQTTYANDGEEVTALAVAFNADYGAEGLGPDGTGFISWPVGSNSETVGANDIIVKYTYFGDADLEGKVYADASAAVNANFTGSSSLVSQGYPNDDWAFGDFDGSGAVNANDAAAVNAFYGFGETGSDSGFPEL